MDDYRKELIEEIIEVAQNTETTVNQCIYEAKELLRDKLKKYICNSGLRR